MVELGAMKVLRHGKAIEAPETPGREAWESLSLPDGPVFAITVLEGAARRVVLTGRVSKMSDAALLVAAPRLLNALKEIDPGNPAIAEAEGE